MSNNLIKLSIVWKNRLGEEECFYQANVPLVMVGALDSQKLLRNTAIFALPDQTNQGNFIVTLLVDGKVYDTYYH